MVHDHGTVTLQLNATQIQGNVRKIRENIVHEFLGIPYAEPPVGHLRFKKPQPLKRWKGVLDATRRSAAPWQPVFRSFGGTHPGEEMWNAKETMSEDCLYLNIWKPGEGRDLPVMVWIYGGGFQTGSATLDVYDGCQLALHGDVVVVAINYRLGSLGFLYLDNEEAPGNQGLWDQVEALRWIKENIDQFGGDPNNVTLFGESAGAVSICCHLLSSHSCDLFHRAIIQSGTALSTWGVLSKDELRRRSIDLATNILKINCDVNTQTVVDDLRHQPGQTFPASDWIVEGLCQWPWTPMIDGDFLQGPPIDLLNKGLFKKCPIIIGTNRNEGMYFLMYNHTELFDPTAPEKQWSFESFESAIEHNFKFYPHYPVSISPSGRRAIQQEYSLENTKDTSLLRGQVDKAASDFLFTFDSQILTEAYATSGQPVYVYYFSRRCSWHPWPEWTGVMHADEIPFVFGLPLRPENEGTYSKEDQTMSENILKMWTRFSNQGNPNSNVQNLWTPYNPERHQHLHIGDDLGMESQDNWTRHAYFWRTQLPEIEKNAQEKS